MDCKSVFKGHIYDNADEFGIDKNKILVSGDGTGATAAYSAALQLSTNGRKVSPLRIHGLCMKRYASQKFICLKCFGIWENSKSL